MTAEQAAVRALVKANGLISGAAANELSETVAFGGQITAEQDEQLSIYQSFSNAFEAESMVDDDWGETLREVLAEGLIDIEYSRRAWAEAVEDDYISDRDDRLTKLLARFRSGPTPAPATDDRLELLDLVDAHGLLSLSDTTKLRNRIADGEDIAEQHAIALALPADIKRLFSDDIDRKSEVGRIVTSSWFFGVVSGAEARELAAEDNLQPPPANQLVKYRALHGIRPLLSPPAVATAACRGPNLLLRHPRPDTRQHHRGHRSRRRHASPPLRRRPGHRHRTRLARNQQHRTNREHQSMSLRRRHAAAKAELPIVYPTLSDPGDFIVVERFIHPDAFPVEPTAVIARVYRRGYFILRRWETITRVLDAKSYRTDSREGRAAIQNAIDLTAHEYERAAAGQALMARIGRISPVAGG